MTPVVRKIKINWLESDGNILIIVWGNMIFKKVVTLFKLRAAAASNCPFPVEAYPLRSISAK